MSILIKNGTIVTSTNKFIADIFVDEGKIKTIGINLNNKADEIIEAKGKYILPGAIDPHTHLSMPFMGTVSQDDFKSGSISAACGGTTTIVDFNLQFKGETIKDARERKDKLAKNISHLDYSFHPGITDFRDDIVEEVKKATTEYGTPSFKIFMYYPFRVNDAAMIRLLETTKECGGLVQVHAESFDIVTHNDKKLEKAGTMTPFDHTKAHTVDAETEAIERAAKLTEVTGSSLYIVHLSSWQGLEIVRKYRDKGVKIFAETCPQYLTLDEERYKEPNWNGAKYVMSPPLRNKDGLEKMWEGLRTGDIQTIATDHCPFSFKGKKDMNGKDDYKKIPNGIPGLETMLPLMYSEGVGKGRISINKLVAITSTNTANIFGLKNKGEIAVGKDADIVVFDPEQEFTIRNEKLHMNVDYNPWEGFNLKGMPFLVFSRGQLLAKWEKDQMVFTGKNVKGKFIKRVPFRETI